MLSITSGLRAPRSASIATATSQTNTNRVADVVRADVADAQAKLARALVNGGRISVLRDEVANQQAALAALSDSAHRSTPSRFISAGYVATGVRADSIALSK